MSAHTKDSDCLEYVRRKQAEWRRVRAAYEDEKVSWMCPGCCVDHGDPCPICSGRGFHADGCTSSLTVKANGPSFEP